MESVRRNARRRRTRVFYYNRQIIYMDLWKDGERVKTAGFLKREETDRGLRWQMGIRGLERTDTGFFDLRDETGALVDKLLLQKGEGRYERTVAWETETRGGRLFGEICGLRAELQGGRYLRGSWKLSGHPEPLADRKTAEQEQEPQTFPDEQIPEQTPSRTASSVLGEEDAGLKEGRLKAAKQQDVVLQPVFQEDKWEQLKQMYPQIHPFGDERMFLSITPGDFVILGQEYQRLVGNSFLLHGYYNYRHLILGRYPEDGGEVRYYLGVPGVCYEREKMAAEMFGFEAFEGKTEPAQEGDFGYYMKRVRI